MKLKDLINYSENNSDKIIINALTQSKDKDIINYVINVVSDLLNGVFLSEEYMNSAKVNIKNYTEDEVGELSTYLILNPYVQSVLKQGGNWEEKATEILEILIGYLIGTIDKDEFLQSLSNIRNLLQISDKFYDELIKYFAQNNEYISESILNKL